MGWRDELGAMTVTEKYTLFMSMDGESCDFEVERTVYQPGLSFSEVAMDELVQNIGLWVGTRIMRRWQATNEPPTVCKVAMKVDVQ